MLPQVALTLREAFVELRLRNGEVLEGDGSLISQATTDSSGRFEFPPVTPGRFVLTASLAGFRALRHELELNRARDWDRAVTLQVGTVQETIVVSAQVHPAFAIAAVDAVRQWRFTPTLLNGDAVEVVMTVSVEFNLSEK